jgi:hypothetical protein
LLIMHQISLMILDSLLDSYFVAINLIEYSLNFFFTFRLCTILFHEFFPGCVYFIIFEQFNSYQIKSQQINATTFWRIEFYKKSISFDLRIKLLFNNKHPFDGM